MTTNFNVRIDEELKTRAFSVIESFGMSPSQFMRLILKQVADTGSLPLSFEKRDREPTKKLLQAIAELERDDSPTYPNIEALLKAANENI